MANSLPLIEGASGLTSVVTWTISIREDWEFVEAALARNVSDSARLIELLITLEHEAVHFLQGLSTAFTYSFSVGLLNLYRELQAYSKHGGLSVPNLLSFKESSDNYWRQFNKTHNGIGVLHLLEAMAVTESYRATAKPASYEGFQRYLNSYFPNTRGVYRKVIEVVREKAGERASFDLTPKLCFLALNGDDPAANFWTFLEGLRSQRDASDLDTCTISERFDMPPEGLMVTNLAALPPDAKHPFLEPYLELLRKVPASKKRLLVEAMAMPGARARSSIKDLLEPLVPAYVACSGGRAQVLGLAKSWPTDHVQGFLLASAVIGAAERLLTSGRPYQSCIHTNCPVYSTALCHAMYPPSAALGWEKCIFPFVTEERFGMAPARLIELRTKADIRD